MKLFFQVPSVKMWTNGLIFLLLVVTILLQKSYSEPIRVFIYGFTYSPVSKFYYGYFTQKIGLDSVTIRDLNNTRYQEEFLKIAEAIIASGIPIISPDPGFCTTCELSQGSTVEDLLIRFSSPMVLVFAGDDLVLVVSSYVDVKILDGALSNLSQDSLFILTAGPGGANYEVNDANLRENLENIVLSDVNKGISFPEAILPVLSLALVDSINPCTFMLFTALLLMVHMTFGRKERVLQTGILFSASVFLGYYLLGVGFVNLLSYALFTKTLIVAAGLTMSFLSIVLGLKGAGKCPMPSPLKRLLMGSLFERSHVSLAAACALGFLSSFTLLPCSSGPYLVGITYMQTLEDLNAMYALLAIYNTIFISPLIVISSSAYLLEDAFDKIDRFKRTNLQLLELISGIVLGAVCIYLLLDLLRVLE